ncbi:MAG: hypothetical protein ACP5NX_00700 [Candidatus Bilamarchaeaceae archaeon]
MLFSGLIRMRARLLLVILALTIGILVYWSGLDLSIASSLHGLGPLGYAVAGAFYTFGLTTPTAFVILMDMMRANNPYSVAIVAAASAALVDTVLFMLVKEQMEKNVADLMKRIRKMTGDGGKLALQAAGFLTFGLPLPDELALAFMEMGEIRPVRLFAIVFCAKSAVLLLAFYGISAIA